MARETDDQPITTRAARERLAPRDEPYWRSVDAGAALGYRRALSGGGTWVARVATGAGRYRKGAIGRADDALKADGLAVLDYRQAIERAKAWASRQHQIAAGIDLERDTRAPYTVADACRDYLTSYQRRGGKSLDDNQRCMNAHIIGPLGRIRLDRLTRQRVQAWLDAVADAPPRLRSSAKPGRPERVRKIDPTDLNALRARRASANRIMTVLKAALNHARQSGHVAGDGAWATVKPFKKVDAPRIRHLTDAETGRLIPACPEDFRQIVTAALLTGMRYGEIVGMRVADFHAHAQTISLSTSKSGKPRLIHLTDEGCAFFEEAIAAKAPTEHVFRRDDGAPWGKSHQFRPLQEACVAAGISPAVSFHILRHSYASRLVMSGVPLGVVAAQIGDSEAITAKHYAHLAPAYVADLVRAASKPLGIISKRLNPSTSAPKYSAG